MNQTIKEHWLSAIQQRGTNRCGRYAPSPTGPLHLGNLRTALIAWLQTRLVGGQFVLRMEDLDLPRVKTASADQIIDDLRWLGIDWDEGPDIDGPFAPYEQSQRSALYEFALNELNQVGKVFPCFCSRKDIAAAASAPHSKTAGSIYPGTCRTDKSLLRISELTQTKVPAWRFQVDATRVNLNDTCAGNFSQTLATEVGDFVLKRNDGLFAYQLAVVVDDIAMGITDVVRGVDLLESTPRQLALFHSFGVDTPNFWHVPLMLDASGQRMAKRDGSMSLQQLRENGQKAQDIVGQLASSLGWVESASRLSAQELLQDLDQKRFLHGLKNTLDGQLK